MSQDSKKALGDIWRGVSRAYNENITKPLTEAMVRPRAERELQRQRLMDSARYGLIDNRATELPGLLRPGDTMATARKARLQSVDRMRRIDARTARPVAQVSPDRSAVLRDVALRTRRIPLVVYQNSASGGSFHTDSTLSPLLTNYEYRPDTAVLRRMTNQVSDKSYLPGEIRIDPRSSVGTVAHELGHQQHLLEDPTSFMTGGALSSSNSAWHLPGELTATANGLNLLSRTFGTNSPQVQVAASRLRPAYHTYETYARLAALKARRAATAYANYVKKQPVHSLPGKLDPWMYRRTFTNEKLPFKTKTVWPFRNHPEPRYIKNIDAWRASQIQRPDEGLQEAHRARLTPQSVESMGAFKH